MKVRPPPLSPGWAEGRYFDLWMAVHLVSGVAGGLSNVFFQLSATGVYGLGAAMMIAWEVGESALGVRESRSNRLIDIAVGLTGVWIALRVAPRLDRNVAVWSFWAALLVGLVLMGFGVRHHRQATRTFPTAP